MEGNIGRHDEGVVSQITQTEPRGEALGQQRAVEGILRQYADNPSIIEDLAKKGSLVGRRQETQRTPQPDVESVVRAALGPSPRTIEMQPGQEVSVKKG